MIKRLIIGLSAVALLACENGSNQVNSVQDSVRTESGFADLAEVSQARRKSAPTENAADDAAGVFLAYRYGYALIMPSASVKSTADKHIQICRNAGMLKCQITGANTNGFSNDNISASLSLRAEPEWLESFVIGLKADITEIDGRIESETTSVADLTRAILDTDARLTAKLTLRTRLEKLLETRNAELADLLTLERELARVQAEIESATANLKALHARVSMSVVNINYKSERLAVSRSSVSPIGTALKDFVGILSGGVAGVINFFAYLLPWLLFLILPGFFVGRWFFRKQMRKIDAKLESDEKEAEIAIEQA